MWQTHGVGDLFANVKYILSNQFGSKFPDLVGDLIKVEYEWEEFKVTLIVVKPVLGGKKTYLTKRTCHCFLNGRPAEIQSRIKSVFFEIYSEFKVASKAMPFVIMHLET